jgi:hypothetical protein
MLKLHDDLPSQVKDAALWFCHGVWLLALVAPLAMAQDADTAALQRQSRDDAWWTGPMLANSAETLSPGHMLAEPYVYDAMSHKTDAFGSRAYVLYGVTDDLSVGFIPAVGYTHVSGGPNSSSIGLGDQILQAQYRLIRYHEGSWMPTVSLMLQQAVPTGRYNRLGSRPANGMGSGAYATTLGVNAQTYFWMPNGRILRVRLDVTGTVAGHADVDGVSVYGTDPFFHGRARPGDNFYVDTSFEYSLTTRWVLATDVIYSYNSSTHVTGIDNPSGLGALPLPVSMHSGSSDTVGYAPAVEYSWTPNIGVLLGVRVLAGGQNTHRSVTPAIAINYVH